MRVGTLPSGTADLDRIDDPLSILDQYRPRPDQELPPLCCRARSLSIHMHIAISSCPYIVLYSTSLYVIVSLASVRSKTLKPKQHCSKGRPFNHVPAGLPRPPIVQDGRLGLGQACAVPSRIKRRPGRCQLINSQPLPCASASFSRTEFGARRRKS